MAYVRKALTVLMRKTVNVVHSPAAFGGLGAARMHMSVITVSYGIFALSLLFQPTRWGLTPAYANLLVIMPQRAWGTCFAVTSCALGTAVWQQQRRWLSITALSLGLAITTTWSAAFIIRWLTSGNTTPETWVSWSVFDYLLLRALFLLGFKEVKIPVRTQRGDADG